MFKCMVWICNKSTLLLLLRALVPLKKVWFAKKLRIYIWKCPFVDNIIDKNWQVFHNYSNRTRIVWIAEISITYCGWITNKIGRHCECPQTMYSWRLECEHPEYLPAILRMDTGYIAKNCERIQETAVVLRMRGIYITSATRRSDFLKRGYLAQW